MITVVLLLLLPACHPARVSDPAAVLLSELDSDGSGELDAAELHGTDLAKGDVDKNGRWNVEELRGAMRP